MNQQLYRSLTILSGRNKPLVYDIYVCKHLTRKVYKKPLIFFSSECTRDQTRPRLELATSRTRVELETGRVGPNWPRVRLESRLAQH
jgi:hypothetical protein